MIGGFDELLLHFADHSEDIGLAVIIAVNSLPQVHLLLRFIAGEGLAGPDDGVLGSHVDVGEEIWRLSHKL